MIGRPTDFTPELGTEICNRIIEVGSLRKVCKADDMPAKSTIFRWLLKGDTEGSPEEFKIFRDQYARCRRLAKEYQFDEHWEDLEKTAHEPIIDDEGRVLQDENGNPVMRVTPMSLGMAKLKHDAFKWQSSKEDPKKYGDKVTQEHVGKDGGAIETKDISMTDIARRMAYVLSSAVKEQKDADDA